MLAIARSDDNFDLLPTAGMGFSFLMSDEGQYLRQQIVKALTEDNRLHTDEVQKLWELVKADITPSRVLGAAWDALLTNSMAQAAAWVPPVAALAGNFQEPVRNPAGL
jgi:hypothetical protein